MCAFFRGVHTAADSDDDEDSEQRAAEDVAYAAAASGRRWQGSVRQTRLRDSGFYVWFFFLNVWFETGVRGSRVYDRWCAGEPT